MGSFFSQPASPTIHYATSPVSFGVRTSDSKETVRITLPEFIETRVPSLLKKYNPAWWLFNGHLQTIYCVFGDFSKINKVVYNRTYLRLQDGGTIGLDFTPANTETHTDTTPVIVVLHGLTGGAGTPVTSPQLYSAGHTDDLRTSLIYIRNRFPSAPLIGIGFSLGANVLTRYAAEEGKASRLIAACALGCPWNCRANNDALNKSFLGYWIYAKGMGANLQKLAARHINVMHEFPSHPIAAAYANTLALKGPTIGDFDQNFTRIGGGSAPAFPFESADAYYDWASSHKVLNDIRIPFLAVSSSDDPVVKQIPTESARNNGYVAVAVTQHGGHLGWFESAPEEGLGQVRRWIKRPALEWIRAAAEDLVDETTPTRIYEENGMLKQEGRDDLGCKEFGDGGVIEGVEGEGGLLAGL